MRFGGDFILTADQFNELHQKVKEEMKRRCACGSLAAYGGPEYDAVAGRKERIRAEDGKKVIEPILAVQDYGELVFPEPGELIPPDFGEGLVSYVNDLAEEPMEGTATSCRGACTGLCMKGCSNACSGCTGGCAGCGGCSGSCGTGCAGGATR